MMRAAGTPSAAIAYGLTSHASARNRKRSRNMIGSTPGRCTLMATSSPLPRSLARYTCPMDAAATGPSLIASNTSLTGRPRFFSMMANATSSGKAGTSSWRTAISAMKSARRMSGLLASTCPILMNVGPRLASISRSCTARLVPCTPLPTTQSHHIDDRYDAKEIPICVPRSTISTGCSSAFWRTSCGEYRRNGEHTPDSSWSDLISSGLSMMRGLIKLSSVSMIGSRIRSPALLLLLLLLFEEEEEVVVVVEEDVVVDEVVAAFPEKEFPLLPGKDRYPLEL
mmetsp:Transcript_542/g.1324  ORF Transcript_542/g.1324 Transcript_542/m.1324 type:complete len:283 (+) Transcript_542:1185-2033(+)